jgi:hypothetical protein
MLRLVSSVEVAREEMLRELSDLFQVQLLHAGNEGGLS